MRIIQFCLALFLIAPVTQTLATATTPVAPITVFQFVSAPGDYIGQGQTVVISAAQAMFSLQNTGDHGQADIYVTNSANNWVVGFSTATGVPFTVGAYPNATGLPFENGVSPGLSIYGDGRGCNRDFGNFDVVDVAYDPVTGVLTRFAANFTQTCESPTSPPLVGAIRFNSSVPTPELIVPFITLTTPLNNRGCIEATSPAGGVAAVKASAACGANLTYTWAASNGSTGSGPLFSLDVPLNKPVTLGLTATDAVTGIVAAATQTLCASDTTPPTITIKSPTQGATYGALPTLVIKVFDAVDKAIKQVDVAVGENAAFPLDISEAVRTTISPRRAVGDMIETQITVTATDASGNVGHAYVQILIKK